MTLSYRNEVWAPISGYEGLYEISNYGRVKTLQRTVNNNGTTVLLAESVTYGSLWGDRYCKGLSKDGVRKQFLAHKLVAEHFLCNKEDKPEVHHKDFDPLNNRVENLEWVTHKENMGYSHRVGRIPYPANEQHGMSLLSTEQVKKILWLHEFCIVPRGYWTDLSVRLGISVSGLKHIRFRHTWKNVTVFKEDFNVESILL